MMSLFVLTGYGVDLFGDCCGHETTAPIEHGRSHNDAHPQKKDEGCQCICHQIVPPISFEPVRVAGALPAPMDYVARPDQIPPDVVPLGIDHPPQLA